MMLQIELGNRLHRALDVPRKGGILCFRIASRGHHTRLSARQKKAVCIEVTSYFGVRLPFRWGKSTVKTSVAR